jgi:hypothetical protein
MPGRIAIVLRPEADAGTEYGLRQLVALPEMTVWRGSGA